MSALLDASPPVCAHFARPYDVAQLDTHPDAARLWATIVAVREECSSEGTLSLDAVCTEAEKVGREDGEANVISTLLHLKLSLDEKDGFLSFRHNMKGEIAAAIGEALDDLAGAVNNQLADIAPDMAALADARAKGTEALNEIRAALAGIEPLAGVDWRTRNDLTQGRVRADALAKALKKEDLAHIAMLAISALHRLANV